MRSISCLTVVQLAAVAALAPLCLADCLQQPVEAAACHQQEQHSDAPSAKDCPGCQRTEFVKPKTTETLTQLSALPAAALCAAPALEWMPSPAIDSPSAPTAVAAPPLVLRL